MGRDREKLAATVEEYLADTPARERQALERVREIVLDTLPEVFERIAYRIVVLAHHGDLVGLASQPRHLSLYTMSPGLVKSMAERLEPYKVSGATIHFTADDPLPADLIEEIVRKRLEENLARRSRLELVSIPLPTLLSQSLVAFTIELDNEWERQLLESKRPRIFLLSLAMWANYLRFLPPEGLAANELESLAQHKVDLNGLTRWRYVTVAPDPAATSKVPRKDWIVRPTDNGRFAQEMWGTLPDLIESRWRDRYGAAKLETLERRLEAVIGQIDGGRTPLYLPDVTSRNEMFTEPPAPPGPAPDSPLPLYARLSRVLLEFTLDFEKESDVALPIAANTLRVLGADPTPMREIPALAGVSKEGTVQALTVLQRHDLAEVEPIPGDRGKQVRLTVDGERARAAYHQVVDRVEESWQSRFGDKALTDLKESLISLVVDVELASSPLAEALQPPPGTWRSTRPAPRVLPHHPMVIGRGGWPDAS